MEPINQFESLKILGDDQRLAILRRLMVAPATLSQLGEYFEETPAHIRYHLKTLEQAGYVELDMVTMVGNLLEKYYRASADAYQINLVITPETPAGQKPLIIGSNDIVLKGLQADFSQKKSGVNPLVLAMDSMEGLVKLQEGICQMATCHLLDPDNAGYNRGYIRHLFAGQPMTLLHLFHRQAGLLVRAGNPKQIHGVEDLARPDVRMINRKRGSGIRVWLDYQLGRQGILPAKLKGYAEEAASHLDVARTVFEERADVGIGLHSSARAFSLEFIPLFEEPYDLVFSQQTLDDPQLAPFFNYLNSGEFGQAVEKIGGYLVTSEFGRVETIS